MTSEIETGDGCQLSASELLAMARTGLTNGPEVSAEEFAEVLKEIPGETIPLSAVDGFPVEPELTSIGGLLRGERHSISGVTAGETAQPLLNKTA